MKWHYWCPFCARPARTDWASRNKVLTCAQCGKNRVPPSPSEQHKAYVDTQDWPAEMEVAVRELRGNRCTIPGCIKPADTLDHRVSFSKKGRTSVANLFPMCTEHNLAKGDQNYVAFLRCLARK